MIRRFLNSVFVPVSKTGWGSISTRSMAKVSMCILSGICAFATPLSAATVVQTASYDADSFVPFLETTLPIAVAIPTSKSDSYSDMDESTHAFDRFDTSLGTLTSVEWYFDIEASLEGDSLYSCVGFLSLGCDMETTLNTNISALAVATVKGDEIIEVPLPDGSVYEVTFPQNNVILPDAVELSETETPSPSGLVGCVAKEFADLAFDLDETCLGGTLQEGRNQQTITDAPLDAYTNGDIEVMFRANVDGTIDTTCQLFGLFGSCYSRNFPDASASFFASLTYHYTPFVDPDPDQPAPSPVPLPAGLPLLLGAIGILGLARSRSKLS